MHTVLSAASYVGQGVTQTAAQGPAVAITPCLQAMPGSMSHTTCWYISLASTPHLYNTLESKSWMHPSDQSHTPLPQGLARGKNGQGRA